METSEHYPDLVSLVINIVEHIEEHGDFIEITNFPKELIFAWKCTKTKHIWTIQLSKVKRLGIWSNDPVSLLIRKMIVEHQTVPNTTEHWQLRIIHDEQIKRLCRMKAFW